MSPSKRQQKPGRQRPSTSPWFDDKQRTGYDSRQGHIVTLGDVATQVRHAEGRVVALEVTVEHLRKAAEDSKAATAKLESKIDRLHDALAAHAQAEEKDRKRFFSGLFFASAAGAMTLIAVLGQTLYWAATDFNAKDQQAHTQTTTQAPAGNNP